MVPTTPDFDKIPFARVNHNKYMVTDTAGYIGTSNWSGDYFIDTAGNYLIYLSSSRFTPTSSVIIDEFSIFDVIFFRCRYRFRKYRGSDVG